MGDVSVKVGHFYTLLGYEVVTAPDNFFYSHAFTMYNSEAFTHTGALATYDRERQSVTLYGGWTLGLGHRFRPVRRRQQLPGRSERRPRRRRYRDVHHDVRQFRSHRRAGYSHSIVVDFALTDNLNYVFQSDWFAPTPPLGDYETIGINQYLFYTINDRVALGARAEWWKADGDSIGAVTAGVNFRPCANLIIRPELRYQWDPGTQNNFASSIPPPTRRGSSESTRS